MTTNTITHPDGWNTQNGNPPAQGELPFDYARYAAHLDGADLTDDQARAILESLWSIMRSLVELGLDVKVCGEVETWLNIASGDAPDAVDSTLPTTTEMPRERCEKESPS